MKTVRLHGDLDLSARANVAWENTNSPILWGMFTLPFCEATLPRLNFALPSSSLCCSESLRPSIVRFELVSDIVHARLRDVRLSTMPDHGRSGYEICGAKYAFVVLWTSELSGSMVSSDAAAAV